MSEVNVQKTTVCNEIKINVKPVPVNPVVIENSYRGIDYNVLKNKPKIEGNELIGDKTAKELLGFDKTDMDATIAVAQGAEDVANASNAKATQAYETATEAKQIAQAVDAKANDALANSNTAVNTANSAKQTAEDVDGKATQALKDSATALETATEAKNTADSYQGQITTIEAKIPSAASATNQLADKQFVQDLTSALNFVTWVDTLPETGESKYIYAVPREETDTDGKPIAALYLWDGTRWNGVGAFSLNIDPDTLATKTELAGYLPLSGGIINGELKVVGPKSTIRTYSGNETSGFTYLQLKAADSNRAAIILTNIDGESSFRQRGKNTEISNLAYNKYLIISSTLTFDNNKVLDASDKAVANGVASLDANTKVPSAQIPTATTSALGGVKPDGTTITVTEDGTISASVSGEGLATKAELQAQAAEFQQELSGKANTNLDNIPSNYDYVVESKTPTADDPTWYRKYKSGWLEQGGLAKNDADVTVTLLKPFADTNYSVQCTNRRLGTDDGWGWIFVLNMTTTSFMARAFYAGGDTTNIRAMWEAKGQGAN